MSPRAISGYQSLRSVTNLTLKRTGHPTRKANRPPNDERLIAAYVAQFMWHSPSNPALIYRG